MAGIAIQKYSSGNIGNILNETPFPHFVRPVSLTVYTLHDETSKVKMGIGTGGNCPPEFSKVCTLHLLVKNT